MFARSCHSWSQSLRGLAGSILFASICATHSTTFAQDSSATGDIATPTSQSLDVKEAMVKFGSGQYDEARTSLERAREKDPRLGPPDAVMASLFLKANQLAAAQNYLERAVKSDPKDSEALLSMGSLALRSGRNTAAYLLFGEALKVSEAFPGDAGRKADLVKRSHIGLATVYELRQDWTNAVNHLKAWFTTDPGDGTAGTRLARALFKSGQAKQAFETFIAVYKANSTTSARPEVNMAILYEQDGKRDQAAKFMSTAVEKDGQNLNTRLTAARWAISTNNIALADQHAVAARKIDPESFDTQFVSGLVARYKKKFDEAEEFLGNAHVKRPSDSSVNNQLALVLIEQLDPDKQRLAGQYAQLNTQIHSDLTQQAGREAATTLAWILFKTDNLARANQIVQQVLQAGSLGTEGAYHAANILAKSGNNAVAAKLLSRALANKGQFAARAEAEALLKKLQGN